MKTLKKEKKTFNTELLQSGKRAEQVFFNL